MLSNVLDKPVTGELYSVGVVTTPVPSVTVHAPLAPEAGGGAGKVIDVEQVEISFPRLTENSLFVMVMVAELLQAPLVIVQTKVLAPVPKLLTSES